MPTAIFIFDSSKPANVRALADLAFYKQQMSVIDAAQDATDPDKLIITFGAVPAATPAAATRAMIAKPAAQKKPAKKAK